MIEIIANSAAPNAINDKRYSRDVSKTQAHKKRSVRHVSEDSKILVWSSKSEFERPTRRMEKEKRAKGLGAPMNRTRAGAAKTWVCSALRRSTGKERGNAQAEKIAADIPSIISRVRRAGPITLGSWRYPFVLPQPIWARVCVSAYSQVASPRLCLSFQIIQKPADRTYISGTYAAQYERANSLGRERESRTPCNYRPRCGEAHSILFSPSPSTSPLSVPLAKTLNTTVVLKRLALYRLLMRLPRFFNDVSSLKIYPPT